jgi:hypothetical protein
MKRRQAFQQVVTTGDMITELAKARILFFNRDERSSWKHSSQSEGLNILLVLTLT